MSTNKLKYLPTRDGNRDYVDEAESREYVSDREFKYLPQPKETERTGKESAMYDFRVRPVIPGMETSNYETETGMSKLTRIFMRNPIVPLALMGMCFCLGRGVYLIGRNTALSDKYMSYNVYCALLAVTSLGVGEVIWAKVDESKRQKQEEKSLTE